MRLVTLLVIAQAGCCGMFIAMLAARGRGWPPGARLALLVGLPLLIASVVYQVSSYWWSAPVLLAACGTGALAATLCVRREPEELPAVSLSAAHEAAPQTEVAPDAPVG